MTTSLTNTLISKYLIKYAIKIAGVDTSSIWFWVEGDDNLILVKLRIGERLQPIVDLFRQTYNDVGFDTTVEMQGTIYDVPSFCKVEFRCLNDEWCGVRRLSDALFKSTFTFKRANLSMAVARLCSIAA